MKRNLWIRALSLLLTLCLLSVMGCDNKEESNGETTVGISEADTMAEDTTVPDTTIEDTTTEDAIVGDTTIEDTTIEDTTIEDTTAEGTTASDTTIEDTTTEDTIVGDTTIEDTTIEDTTAEDTTAEGTTAPDTTIEDTTTEDTIVGDTTVEDTTAEDTTVPDTTAPVTTEEPVTTEVPDTDPPETACVHDYQVITIAATCTKDGSKVTTCSKCGDSKTEAIKATGHDYKTTTIAATCTKDGSKITTCTKCGDSKTEAIKATGHDYQTTTIAATCTKDGSKVTTCTKCGDTKTETLPATGHAYETVTTSATCTKDGSKVTTCSKCGDTKTETLPATGHAYQTTTTPPTPAADGEIRTVCGNCGDTEVEVLPAIGRDFVAPGSLSYVGKVGSYVYLDVATTERIALGGIARPADNNGEYFRLDAANKSAYPEDIQREAATTAGSTLRFRIYGGSFRIKAIRRTDVDFVTRDPYAFDIYLGTGTERVLWKTVKASSFGGNFESETLVLPEGVQEVMICLPRTVGFTSLQVAFSEDSYVAAPPARTGGAVGFYGSSISHGYSATSPSLSYAMTICRALDADCVNFGLSGAARGEKAVIDDICDKIRGAGLTAFVLEYDWNINSSYELEYGSTYWNGYPYYTIYEKLRAALGPDVPIVMISRPWFGYGTGGITDGEVTNCINVISRACDKAKAAGDDAVIFISGKTFFGTEGALCHADTVHPNNKGNAMMAAKILEALGQVSSDDEGDGDTTAVYTVHSGTNKFTCTHDSDYRNMSLSMAKDLPSPPWEGAQYFLDGTVPYTFFITYTQAKQVNEIMLLNAGGVSTTAADLAGVGVYYTNGDSGWTKVNTTVKKNGNFWVFVFEEAVEAKYFMLHMRNPSSRIRCYWREANFFGVYDSLGGSNDDPIGG